MKSTKLNKFFLFIVLPLFLIVVWAVSSLLFNKTISFSVLTYSHNVMDSEIHRSGRLFKGQKATGEFKAKENHLGMVILEFKDFVKPDFRGEDVLVFRLKEKGQKEWYYSQNYRSGGLEKQLKFPFGFPIIEDSKDRDYEFEIESLYGNERNAIELNKSVSLATAYQFPKSEIQASRKKTLDFIVRKAYLSFTNIDFLLSSTLYLFPLFLYLSALRFIRKFVVAKKTFGIFVLSLLALDVVFIKEVHLGILLTLILGWVISIKVFKLESKYSFALATVGILFWAFLLIFKMSDIQNKLNIWTYFFLMTGLIQAVLEERRLRK